MNSFKEIESLVLKTLEVEFDKKHILFKEGEKSREFYILLSGTIDVFKGSRLINTVDKPGTYLGEMSSLLDTPRTATLITSTPCRMYRVPGDKVAQFFQHSPEMGIKLAKALARRLLDMDSKYEKLLELVSPTG
jgi:CRP-like cAMP-binding protein